MTIYEVCVNDDCEAPYFSSKREAQRFWRDVSSGTFNRIDIGTVSKDKVIAILNEDGFAEKVEVIDER